ncbi:hypothetical protein BJV82DRAFT_580757 [Fennellomyces sp. T-0311]|nr:hypothetical protein BJV82DRAFT_580757 [Fennellomyces sp. T-0311]
MSQVLFATLLLHALLIRAFQINFLATRELLLQPRFTTSPSRKASPTIDIAPPDNCQKTTRVNDLHVDILTSSPYDVLCNTLVVRDEKAGFALALILARCPNIGSTFLTVFHIYHFARVPHTKLLASIELCTVSSIYALIHVELLLKSAPSIRHLNLNFNNKEQIDILPTITEQRCPRLITVVINRQAFRQVYDVPPSVSKESDFDGL